jgi:ADP-dependent NAD(P)H-hydrate dehydratase / NAD(P)H-hydrate epimerase
MIPILTPEESAELDRASAALGVTTRSLMESAGRSVAQAASLLAGGTYGRRAVVVVGKGNNGGDGLVAARHLDRWGMGATAVMVAAPHDLAGAAAESFRMFVDRGGRWRPYSAGVLGRELARADVVVDALFGTGFRGAPDGDHALAIQAVNLVAGPVVAVDIPSGVDGATGAVRGDAVQADATVTFGALKPGLVFHPGAALAGVISVADIGFPPELVRSDLSLVERTDVAAVLPKREPETHKRSTGVVLVVAGSRAMTGAAVLVARAATHAGAGLVTVAVPESILTVVEVSITETTFLPLPETEDGTVSERAMDVLEDRLVAADSVAIGPGMTTNPETSNLIRRLVAKSPVPMVLDADGLNAFAGRGSELADRQADAAITPHAGEFGRVTGLSSKEMVENRVGHARKAARDFDCTVLLKGSRTIVAEPNGRAVVNPTGGSFLATAGTGDVLTGTIAALLATGLPSASAAMAGAYLHGLAGRIAADGAADRIVAPDVVARLPAALAQVLGEE